MDGCVSIYTYIAYTFSERGRLKRNERQKGEKKNGSDATNTRFCHQYRSRITRVISYIKARVFSRNCAPNQDDSSGYRRRVWIQRRFCPYILFAMPGPCSCQNHPRHRRSENEKTKSIKTQSNCKYRRRVFSHQHINVKLYTDGKESCFINICIIYIHTYYFF